MHESSQTALSAIHAVKCTYCISSQSVVETADTPTTAIDRAPPPTQGVDLVFYGDSITGASHARG